MPLYDYRCSSCDHLVEVRHGFDETYDRSCPVCGAALKRVFNPAPIVFKGSGFYVTDSRSASAKGKEAKPAEAASGEAKPAESAPAAKSDAPAPSPAASPASSPKDSAA